MLFWEFRSSPPPSAQLRKNIMRKKPVKNLIPGGESGEIFDEEEVDLEPEDEE